MHGANGMRIRGTSFLTDRTITMRYCRKSPVYPSAPPRRLRCRQELTAARNFVRLGAQHEPSPGVEIRKAIITAAGKSQRTLPLQTLVDRDGVQKTALAALIEEILLAGVEQVCVVIWPGDQSAYAAAAGSLAPRLQFVEQSAPLGYGHAVHCAKAFAGNQPFLLLVGDHLYVSGNQKRCAQQLVEVAAAENCAVSAVQATHESKLPYYGAVGGRLVPARKGLYEVAEVMEKPTPTEAEQKLIACELQGHRYDIGVKYGLLIAQLALALEGGDRDEVLSGLVELLAVRAK